MELILKEHVSVGLTKGMVPYSIYSIQVDHIEVGTLIYRDGNEEECYYDGHIGYTIEEQYRGHNYAYQACLLLKDFIQKDEVYITCSPHNIASRKTIEKLNAIFIEKTTIPSYLKKFYSKEDYDKLIYKWRVR